MINRSVGHKHKDDTSVIKYLHLDRMLEYIFVLLQAQIHLVMTLILTLILQILKVIMSQIVTGDPISLNSH